MAVTTPAGGHQTGFGSNTRTDNWWAGPLATLLGLSAFGVYATWAAFQGVNYYAEPYLSPFYSPLIFIKEGVAGGAPLAHAWIGTWPAWWPSFLPASPAFFILAFPGSFRFTCYYYRKAYYRAFTGTPPACAVGGVPQKGYRGETRLLLFQNLHRYAMYFALVFVVILYYDAFLALKKNGVWGFGVGTAVLFINATLLGGYTFGCHSFRHLIGGRKDCFSCDSGTSTAYKAWSLASVLNRNHMAFAWISLFWVGFTDLYVRMVAMGVWTDLNTWN
jgi:hypothetical protein